MPACCPLSQRAFLPSCCSFRWTLQFSVVRKKVHQGKKLHHFDFHFCQKKEVNNKSSNLNYWLDAVLHGFSTKFKFGCTCMYAICPLTRLVKTATETVKKPWSKSQRNKTRPLRKSVSPWMPWLPKRPPNPP